MPLYEYRCAKCGRTIEVLQSMKDAPLTIHDDCGGALEKQISSPAIQFKGAGWYVTDYSGKSGGGKSDAGKSEGSKSDSGSSDGGSEKKSGGDSGGSSPAKSDSGPAKKD